MDERAEWGREGDWSFMPADEMKALEEAATLERHVHDDESSTKIAQRILDDASIAAAQSIVQIATKDPSSSVRLRAASYVIDRALGKAGAEPNKANPWDELF